MSEKSIIGSMPWLNRFMPSVTRSTLPVRSPWPNRQPSTRSAPAIMRQLGRGDRRAPVVVRVQADHGVLAPGELAAEPLDLVGVDVGRRHLDGRRQVEDDLAAVLGLPHVGDRLAHVDRERQLGAGEDLRAVLVADDGACRGRTRRTSSPSRCRGWRCCGPRPCHVEDHPAEQRRQRRCRGGCWPGGTPTSDCTVRSIRSSRAWVSTEIVTSSGIRSPSISWRTKSKSVSDGRGEADLDLLVAHPDQEVEHLQLAGRAHRVDERLVAVAQVGGQPARRLGDRPRRPGAVGQVDRREGAVALDGHAAGLLGTGDVEGAGHEVLAEVGAGAAGRTHSLRSEGVRLVLRPRCGSEGGGWRIMTLPR